MAEMSRTFNFDDFDERCRETIESSEHMALDAKLCLEGLEHEFSDMRPPVSLYVGELPDPPEAA